MFYLVFFGLFDHYCNSEYLDEVDLNYLLIWYARQFHLFVKKCKHYSAGARAMLTIGLSKQTIQELLLE